MKHSVEFTTMSVLNEMDSIFSLKEQTTACEAVDNEKKSICVVLLSGFGKFTLQTTLHHIFSCPDWLQVVGLSDCILRYLGLNDRSLTPRRNRK